MRAGRSATPTMGATKTINEYQLGDSIGKGAFGTVYQGLNMKTGEVVAIKQITLQNIPKSELDAMMVEIDLLKKLHHTNIVRYIGFVKTKDFLNIILEYCENGSLQSICKKFGKFPEQLMAVYTTQVLEGLVYLHQEGVIHRDIKGANILTTKEGHVKLADFGVATHTTDIGADNAVVGSPYWMAPEVIEMTGGTTASDIWSVGSTIIELMTGEPPYFDLSPMSALFRIVQDDHPPLPDGISAALHDFFMQCFQKDCNLRVSASKLLKHKWLQQARKDRQQTAEEKKNAITTFSDNVQSIVEWNESIQVDTIGKMSTIKTIKMLKPNVNSPSSKPPSRNSSVGHGPATQLPSIALAKPGETGRFAPIRQLMASADDDDDNWDSEFDDGTPPRKKLATLSTGAGAASPATVAPPTKEKESAAKTDLVKKSSLSDKDNLKEPKTDLSKKPSIGQSAAPKRPDLAAYQEDDDEGDDWSDVGGTARKPMQIKASLPVLKSAPKPPSPTVQLKPSLSTYSEKDDDDDDFGDDFDAPAQPLKLNPKLASKGTGSPLMRPDDLKNFKAPAPTSQQPQSEPSPLPPQSAPLPSTPSIVTKFAQQHVSASLPSPLKRGGHHQSQQQHPLTSAPASVSAKTAGQLLRVAKLASEEMVHYQEKNREDDYSEEFNEEQKASTLKLKLHLAPNDDESLDFSNFDALEEEEDVFAAVDDFEDLDFDEQREKNRLAAQMNDLLRILSAIHRGSPDDAVIRAADRLIDAFQENPQLKDELLHVRNNLVPIVDLLDELAPVSAIIPHLLNLIAEIVQEDADSLEWFVSVGGLASVVRFAGSPECSSEGRQQALQLLSQAVTTSQMTRQGFVSCRGIPVLVRILEDSDYDKNVHLVRMAFECVAGSLDLVDSEVMDTGLSKSQLYVLYASAGLLPAVAHAFHEVLMDPNDHDSDLAERMVDLFTSFTGMVSVRSSLSSRPLLKALIRDVFCLPPALQLKVLKVLRDVSMLSANSLDLLQKVDAIPVLVSLLDRKEGPFAQEIRTMDVFVLFNLCRVYKPRQEAAALAGIVPHLKYFTSIKSQMKEFAVQLLADMTDASAKTREILWQNDMVVFFINQLSNSSMFIQHVALQALASWLQPETAKVESVLVQPDNMKKIIIGLSTGKFVHATAMGSPLESLYKMILVSTTINQALGQSALVKVLAEKLGNPDVHIRLTLLKIVTSLYTQHKQQQQLVKENPKLQQIVARLAESEKRVLVAEMARKLRDEFAKSVAS